MNQPGNDERGQHGVQALETGLTVLEAFTLASGPLRLSDIANLADMHPAKAHRYLVSFIRKNYVVQDANGRYQLGPNSIRVGLSCLAQMDRSRLITESLDNLSVDVNETVAAAVWSTTGPMILSWRPARRPIAVNLQTGAVLPLLSSAVGQVFMAYGVPKLVEPLVQKEAICLGEGKELPTAGERMSNAKQQMRALGVGMATGSHIAGINAISAPVFNHEGQLVAALAIIGLEQTFDAQDMRVAAETLRRTTAGLSSQMGYRPFTEFPFNDPADWA